VGVPFIVTKAQKKALLDRSSPPVREPVYNQNKRARVVSIPNSNLKRVVYS
jgi:hypothetical protein